MQQSDTDSVLLVSENWSVLEKSGHTRSFEHSSEIMSKALRDVVPSPAFSRTIFSVQCIGLQLSCLFCLRTIHTFFLLPGKLFLAYP